MFGIFGFVDDVKSGVLNIYNILVDVKEAPTFSLTFNNKYLTGTYNIIDLSWYAPYKEYGDNVICMFFYLGFIWHVFTKLSSIISGVDTSYTTIEDSINGKGGKD